MKKISTLLLVSLSFMLFVPISSAKFKDCWGNWQTGYPVAGDCYGVNSVIMDEPSQSSVYNFSRIQRVRNPISKLYLQPKYYYPAQPTVGKNNGKNFYQQTWKLQNQNYFRINLK